MAYEKKTPDVPVTSPKASQPVAEVQDDKEWDGQGNRVLAIREGKADAELIQNGLTSFPSVAGEPKTDEHTGRYISETTFGEPGEVKEPEGKIFRDGDVVEGLTEEQLRPLIASGAVRRETKDEAKDK